MSLYLRGIYLLEKIQLWQVLLKKQVEETVNKCWVVVEVFVIKTAVFTLCFSDS